MVNLKQVLEEKNYYTDSLTDYVNELQDRAGDRKLAEFAESRHYDMEIIKSRGIFYIGDATEMLIPSYMSQLESFGVISNTNYRPIFHDRYVMPIKDIDGRVLNLVGYSKDADERYIYGTARYYRRRDTAYGLENLTLAYKLGFGILTEGITDTIMVEHLGYKNSFANCGTHRANTILRQLNRCEHGIIKIPDRDRAGKRASDKWELNRSITLNVFVKFKDIDALCRESEDNKKWAKEYLDICADWVKSGKHNGFQAQSEIITMQ